MGFIPSKWGNYSYLTNHFTAGGGLGLRGYSGYLLAEKNSDGTIKFNYKGITGLSINTEIEFGKFFKKIKLKEKGFSFCPEITTKISLMNIDVEEFPINYNGRTYNQGKKITAFDGLDALYVLLKYRYFK